MRLDLFAKRPALLLAVTDVGWPAYAFGVDSLVAVELLVSFSSEVRADLRVVQIPGSSAKAELGAVTAVKSEHSRVHICRQYAWGLYRVKSAYASDLL